MQNVWMITGASGGLGKGIAEAALRRGDAVALTSRSPEKLNAMVAEFPKQAMAVKLELDRIGSMEKALHQVYARLAASMCSSIMQAMVIARPSRKVSRHKCGNCLIPISLRRCV